MASDGQPLLLVTGATGFVGSHVVDRAVAQGMRVRAFVRNNSSTRRLQKQGVECVVGSMVDLYSIKGALRSVTHVVHCAAHVGDWGDDKLYQEVNVQGLEHLVEAIKELPDVQRVVHLSSVGVYPFQDHHGTVESAANDTGAIDAYTRSKQAQEKIVRRVVKMEKLPIVMLRPGLIYGPRDRTFLPPLLDTLERKRFAFVGTGEAVLSNTYIGNLIDAIFLALDHPDVVGEAFNIRDPRPVSRVEFIRTIIEHGGYPTPTRHLPPWLAIWATSVMEGAWKLFGIERPPLLNRARLKFLMTNLDFSIDKAQAKLGYSPSIDFQQGMETTMQWFNRKGGE